MIGVLNMHQATFLGPLLSLLLLAFDPAASAQASVNIDRRDIRSVLLALVPLIQKGFDERQVAEVEQLAKSMDLDDERDIRFKITYKNQQTTLLVVLHCDDVDDFEVFFWTVPELAKEIQAQIRSVVTKLGTC